MKTNESSQGFIVGIFVTIFTGIFSILLYAWVFNSIQHRKGYPSKYTKLNALISSLLMIVMQLIGSLQNIGSITMEQNYWCCKLWSFFCRITFCMSAFTILEIFCEVSMTTGPTTRNLSQREKGRDFLHCLNLRKNYSPLRIFLLMWFVVFVLSLPGIATNSFSQDENETRCDKVFLFDSRAINFIYEVCFWSLISFLPSIIMVTVLYSWGFRWSFLYFTQPIPPGLKRHVRRIRLAFLNMIIFILLWVPMGVILFFRKKSPTGIRNFNQNPSIIPHVIRFFLTLQLSLQPAIFMYAQFEIKVRSVARKWYSNICSKKRGRGNGRSKGRKSRVSVSYIVMETVNPTNINFHRLTTLTATLALSPPPKLAQIVPPIISVLPTSTASEHEISKKLIKPTMRLRAKSI